MRLIGLDVGTTGCKAIVFTTCGEVIGEDFQEYDIDTAGDSFAEQDAEYVWTCVKKVLKGSVRAARETSPNGQDNEVRAMGVSVQGDAVIPIDGQGKALAPAVLGMDYRSHLQSSRAAELCGERELFKKTGMRPHPMNSVTKMMLLKDEKKLVYESAEGLVTYADFIYGKLGAPGYIDYSMASRTMAFSLAAYDWDPQILHALGIDKKKLSTPVASGTPIGTIDPGVAAEVGLSENVKIVSGGHDQTCAAVGAGSIFPGVGVVSTGTAEVFSVLLEKPRLDDEMYNGYYPCYCHVVPQAYFSFSLNHVGGLLLKWYRDSFCQKEAEEAQQQGKSVFSLLDERMPEGPTEVMVLPHFNGSGTPWCDMQSRGAVIGMTLNTSKYEVARAILESQTYELAINIQKILPEYEQLTEITAVGGGAKSPEWLQIKADVLAVPIKTMECSEAGCMGAAIVAGAGSGVFQSLQQGVDVMVRVKKIYRPNEKRVERYKQLFSTYQKVYPALKPLYQSLKNG